MNVENVGDYLVILGLYVCSYSGTRIMAAGLWVAIAGVTLATCNFPHDGDNWLGGMVALAVMGGIQFFLKKARRDSGSGTGL